MAKVLYTIKRCSLVDITVLSLMTMEIMNDAGWLQLDAADEAYPPTRDDGVAEQPCRSCGGNFRTSRCAPDLIHVNAGDSVSLNLWALAERRCSMITDDYRERLEAKAPDRDGRCLKSPSLLQCQFAGKWG